MATGDLTSLLWALKLGALLNLWFIARTLSLASQPHDAQIVVPALILFAVSAYRCLLPNRYKDNVVLHATPLSSSLVTRVLATFSEVAYIYQFSHVLRVLNENGVAWVDAASWLMVLQVCVSQIFVWGSLLTGRLSLFVLEELGWAVIFVLNTAASAYLLATVDGLGAGRWLLQLSLGFGAFYLPWQGLHLRSLVVDARDQAASGEAPEAVSAARVRSLLFDVRRSTGSEDWGGAIGVTWMVAYWATLIPLWVYVVVERVAVR